jgi:hypothetical protein
VFRSLLHFSHVFDFDALCPGCTSAPSPLGPSVIFGQRTEANSVSGMFLSPAKAPRRSQRHWIALPVRIRTGNLRVDGVTINVSEHGMYLFTATNLSLGTEIEIAFRSSDNKNLIHASGIVRRKAVYLYGIEFLNNVAPYGPCAGPGCGTACESNPNTNVNSITYSAAVGT